MSGIVKSRVEVLVSSTGKREQYHLIIDNTRVAGPKLGMGVEVLAAFDVDAQELVDALD